MFLKELWLFNKKIFAGFMLFIFLMLVINYKWGAVATPVYQFGMFSSKFYMKDTQNVYKIYVNDNQLDITKYHFAERDMLLVSLQNYTKQKSVNQSVYNTMKQIPEKIGLTGVMNPEKYLNNTTDADFTNWYRKLLESITGYPVLKLEIYQQKVQWQNGSLRSVSSPEKLSFLVTN